MTTAQIDKWYCITDDKKVYGPWNSHHEAVMSTNHISGIRTIANGENVPPNAKVLPCPSISDKQLANVQAEWESDGFKFIGNGFENHDDDDDPNRCPMCGETNVFWALWEHQTRIRNANKDTEYKPHLLNAINRCYDCGYNWLDIQEEN